MPTDKTHKTIHQIKADHEAYQSPATASHHHNHFHLPSLPHLHLRRHQHRSHSTPPPALHTDVAMSSKKSISSNKTSLNSILDAAEAQWKPALDSAKSRLQAARTTTPRPSSSTRPSWIGPTRSVTPGIHAMAQPVTLFYSSPGLQPPVYAFTNLSDPKWEAVEMDAKKNDKGEWNFSKTFSVEPGDYQYKFRLGPGDWWALDDQHETVNDELGNQNNLLVVKEPESHDDIAPLMQHETLLIPPLAGTQTPVPVVSQPDLPQPETAHNVAPLMAHERLGALIAKDETPGNNDEDAWNGDGEDKDLGSSPLLRHEILSLRSAEHETSPRFSHKTIALGERKDEVPPTPSKVSVISSPVAPEASPHDIGLEPFPSDHIGIMETLHRTATQNAVDETTDESIGSPIKVAREDDYALSPVTSLPSVQEDDEEIKQHGDSSKPLAPMTPPMTPKEDEQIMEEIIVGLTTGETVDEVIERAVEISVAREELAAAVMKDISEEDSQKSSKKLSPSGVQQESKSVVDILTAPLVCLAVVGVAVLLTAAGLYAGRGGFSDLLQKI
ncbi:Hypothetical protein R9X50_00589900 [Acrodontium crateriforme]|uniref:AMP-activated protein kinase glycogen-binding domain-containing protein n=1 Tax=Acrodontium crateriforme TaxID=150365 RepID=A0AAQ3M835_9PEZI|nr:Hypothetical protein R9X50_00589900 [Acrodontium crateriforme]